MIQKNCCKGCRKRYESCHDTCVEHMAEELVVMEERHRVYKKMDSERRIDKYQADQIKKAKKRSR